MSESVFAKIEKREAEIRKQEREEIIFLLEQHPRVCNYQAVNEIPCDVCSWMNDIIAQLKGRK